MGKFKLAGVKNNTGNVDLDSAVSREKTVETIRKEQVSEEELSVLLKEDHKRQLTQRAAAGLFIASVVLCFVCGYAGDIVPVLGSLSVLFVVLAIASIVWLVVTAIRGSFSNEIGDAKLALVPGIAGKYMEDVVYSYRPDTSLNSGLRNSFKAFYNASNGKSFNEYKFEDIITGKYDGHKLLVADAYIADEHTDSDGDTHTVTRFKGQYISFDTGFTNTADVLVMKKSGVGSKFERDNGIRTDNHEFNKKWQVVTDDEQQALYILTPSFMERLEELDAKVCSKRNGRNYCNCYAFRANGTVEILAYTEKDLFEFPYAVNSKGEKSFFGKTPTVEDCKRLFEQEFEWLVDLVESLSLVLDR